MFLNPGRNGKDVRIKDDVLGREPHFLDENTIGTGADLGLAVKGIGLPGLVEGHDHDGGAIGQAQARVMAEGVFAFFQADGIDHRLALHALQAGLDHLPFGTVDHDRHAGDIGLRGNEVQELDHRLPGVDKPLVHIDVDDLCAVLDLIARNLQCRGIIAVHDQFAEPRRAGDIRALAHVHKGNIRGQDKGFKPRKAKITGHAGTFRGEKGATDSAMARIWSGVVPQQPPTTLTMPSRAKSATWRAVSSGPSSYSPKALGRPAFG